MAYKKGCKLSVEDIKWAYQHFFNRTPENQEVIQYHLENSKNLKDLVENIMKSREYEYKKYKNISSGDKKHKIYYFFHIYKTGGMSVHEYLYDATPKGYLMPGFFEQDLLSIENLLSFSYYSGHFGRIPLMLKERRLHMATLLRNPVERGFSHYKHIRRTTELEFNKNENGIFDEKIRKEILSNSLEEFLHTSSASLVFGNHQASQLAELTASSMHLIRKSIEGMITLDELHDLAMESLSKMELVGITQRLDEFIGRLADRWKLPQPQKKYQENIDPDSEAYHLTKDMISRIEKLCSVDLKIYNYFYNLLVN